MLLDVLASFGDVLRRSSSRSSRDRKDRDRERHGENSRRFCRGDKLLGPASIQRHGEDLQRPLSKWALGVLRRIQSHRSRSLICRSHAGKTKKTTHTRLLRLHRQNISGTAIPEEREKSTETRDLEVLPVVEESVESVFTERNKENVSKESDWRERNRYRERNKERLLLE